MSIATYSPGLTLVFAWAILWSLMDLHVRELTRRQKWIMTALTVVMVLLNELVRDWLGTEVAGRMIWLTMHLPTFFIFWWLTKCSFVKMAFMILSALVFTSPVVIIGKSVAAYFSDKPVILLLASVFVHVVILLLIRLLFRRGISYLFKYGDDKIFLMFSTVPLIYYVYVFTVQNVDLTIYKTFSGYVIRFLPTVMVFMFYGFLMYSYKSLSEKKEAEAKETALTHKLDFAQEQLRYLNDAKKKLAIYQHDLRHHMVAIEGMLAKCQFNQAEEYTKQVRQAVESIVPARYCENELMNLMCASFADKAEQEGVRFQVEAKLPKALDMDDAELCSIVSNGLENALHAVSELDRGERWITLYCGVRLNKLLIEIKNPHVGKIVMRNGLPISCKKNHGYGCLSIHDIAERYNGMCTFESKDGVFVCRVVLPWREIVE